MPIEARLLHSYPVPLSRCPVCGAEPFETFMRGMVHRGGVRALIERARCWWRGDTYRYCALICYECKEIVGYEAPLWL